MKMNMWKIGLSGIVGGVLLWAQAQAYDPCDCECDNQYWGSAEYLYWKIQDSPKVVPLVVTGPVVTGGAPVTGYEVVLGGKKIDNNWRSGGRFALGYWFDDEQCWGGEVSYFFLPNGKKTDKVFSDGAVGSPFLAVPFFDVVTGADSSTTVAFPASAGGFSGFAKLTVYNNLQGAELNGIARMSCDCDSHFDLLAGFRYLYFSETLKFVTDSPYVAPFIPGRTAPDIFKTLDRFKTENNFYGGQIGFAWETTFCDEYFFNLKAKVALGLMNEKLNIEGKLITNDFVGFDPAPPVVYEGGYFALPTNIGHHKKNQFAVIPEVNINLGYQVMDCLSIQVGYSFLYVSRVLYATNQVDPNINPSQSSAIDYVPNAILVGQASPEGHPKSKSLWAQGVTAGLEYRY